MPPPPQEDSNIQLLTRIKRRERCTKVLFGYFMAFSQGFILLLPSLLLPVYKEREGGYSEAILLTAFISLAQAHRNLCTYSSLGGVVLVWEV